MNRRCDLAIIGAGPAGMCAALEAAHHALTVLVVDEQPRPGGQIYRQAAYRDARLEAALGPDYRRGRPLIDAFQTGGIDHLSGATVWEISADGRLGILHEGDASFIQASEVLVATGAIERPVPVPGWTRPGVMTAGAGQILLKTAGLVPEKPVVLAGGGPLLYLLASQYLEAGASIQAILETVPIANYLSAARYLPGAVYEARLLAKGVGMMAALRRAGVRLVRRVDDLEVEGGTACEAVSFRRRGQKHRLETELVLLHEGVIPNTQITMALGCDHQWDPVQRYWRPSLDAWGRTSNPHISVAGDGGAVWGAEAAALTGRLAALGAAHRLDALSAAARDHRAAPHRRSLRRLAGARRFLDRLYRPPEGQRLPMCDDIVVCRCEEVTAGEVRRAARLGAVGLTQAKAYTRCGMGPCQGRLCGPTVAAIIASERGIPEAEVPPYRPRPPFKPVTLAALARSVPSSCRGD